MGTGFTIRLRWAAACAIGGLLCTAASGQTVSASSAAAWRKLGNASIGLNLAGPAGGAVDSVWFSASGDRLFARTQAGLTYETLDYISWKISKNIAPVDDRVMAAGVRSPERGARVQSAGGRLYSLGMNLQASDDDGRSWINLTGYNGVPVIGPHQRSLAISPLDARQIVVANDLGVWRSADGGLSWSGLNEELPNLPMRRLLPTLNGTIRAEVEGIGAVELPPAAAAAQTNWVRSTAVDELGLFRQKASSAIGTPITAFAKSVAVWYAGSADGRLWTSVDSGGTWILSAQKAGGAIEAIAIPDDLPHTAVAVSAAFTGTRILRTTGDGAFWDDLSGGLPDGPLHGIAVDSASGVAYIAGDRGVFYSRLDLGAPGPAPAWQRISGLPDAHAMDIKLDRDRNQLYAALDGYGLYAAPAPQTSTAVRVLNAADQTALAAAPGALLHVVGSGLASVKSDAGGLALVTASSSSVQVQVPFAASGSTLPLTIESTQGQKRMSLPLKSAAPSILVDGDGSPILVDAASGLTLDARNLARPGSRIQVFAAGLGRVSPDWRAGIPAPEEAPAVVARVDASLDGVAVEVTRATLAPGYVGLYLVEVQLPGLVNAGVADFALMVNGEASNRVKIVLSRDN